MYKDMNDLAHDAASAVEDAVGWLETLVATHADALSEERTEALESAADFARRAANALHEYAYDTVDIPEREWTMDDLALIDECGQMPTRDVLIAPEFEAQSSFSRKLWALEEELNNLVGADPATLLATRVVAFDCVLQELPKRLETAFAQVAPAVEDHEVRDHGPGFDYHPKC